MNKSTVGFFLGLFFGILGLLGLLACDNGDEKNSFMRGWWTAVIICIVVVVIIVLMVSCTVCASLKYYY